MALVNGVEAVEWRYIAGALLGIAVCWSLLLRPRVVLEQDELVMRNAVSDYRVPYSRISEFFVRSTTVVLADGRKFLGLGVGRRRADMTRTPRVASDPLTRAGAMVAEPERLTPGKSAADQLEEQVDVRRNLAAMSEAPVRRVPAVPEIVALVATALALVIAIVL